MTPCWEWNGGRTTAGYGVTRLGGKVRYLHRLVYTLVRGPIPYGLELDHLCRNRACYRPDHLEPVTHAENMRRGYWATRTHCPEGHPYDEHNTIVNSVNGGRQCRECKNGRRRKGKPRSKTHCPQGHAREGNTEIDARGIRRCAICTRQRKAAWKAKQPRKYRLSDTHCVHGHERTKDNTAINGRGARYCLDCQRARRGRAA